MDTYGYHPSNGPKKNWMDNIKEDCTAKNTTLQKPLNKPKTLSQVSQSLISGHMPPGM